MKSSIRIIAKIEVHRSLNGIGFETLIIAIGVVAKPIIDMKLKVQRVIFTEKPLVTDFERTQQNQVEKIEFYFVVKGPDVWIGSAGRGNYLLSKDRTCQGDCTKEGKE